MDDNVDLWTIVIIITVYYVSRATRKFQVVTDKRKFPKSP